MALYMYASKGINMYKTATATSCESFNGLWDKPSKYEQFNSAPRWAVHTNRCPDCDKKRITACQDPNCAKTQTH